MRVTRLALTAALALALSTSPQPSTASAAVSSPAPAKHYVPPPDAPTGIRILDVDLHDRRDSWVLLSVACGSRRCAALSQSRDQGRHWHQLPTTKITTDYPGLECQNRCYVSKVRFVTAKIGYLYGPGFTSTADGGKTWTRLAGVGVDDMAKVGATVLRVVQPAADCVCNGDPGVRLQHLDDDTGAWITATHPIGAGQSWGRLAVSGDTAYFLLAPNFASGAINAATLLRSTDHGEHWREIADPCAGDHLEAAQLVATATRTLLQCGSHGGPRRVELKLSVGGGPYSSDEIPFAYLGPIALAGRDVLLETGGDGRSLHVRTDHTSVGGGWTTDDTQLWQPYNDLEVEHTLEATPEGLVGWIGSLFTLHLSHDFGHTWVRVPAASL